MSSLRHILADDPVEEAPRIPPATPAAPLAAPITTSPVPLATPALHFGAATETPITAKKEDPKDEPTNDADAPVYTSTTQTTRRNANGSVSSVFSGNKIRHLKKEDGVPLWRKDIQYDFLCMVFNDDKKVFTRYSDGTNGHTFAEVYVDAMAKSSKCSKILKEKLAQDSASAITMAMVCLLVNVGRMNTTLNFFPEMRAQLRTYHSIPALQAHQDPNAYKQLQDAPRLKSILKGATEDEPQPGTIEDIKAAKIPRTNPVNLIFVLSQYAPKISEVHFSHPRDFFDLVMRPSLSSRSRATAFLWLIWWYLESDFTKEDALNNPYGPGQEGDAAGGGIPVKVPTLEGLTEEQAALENVDTPEEEEFGESKRKERIAIVASEPSPAMTALKRARKERSVFAAGLGGNDDLLDTGGANTPSRDYQSPAPHGSAQSPHEYAPRNYMGSEHTRSPSPPTTGFQAINTAKRSNIKNLLSEDENAQASPPASGTSASKKGPGRGNWRRGGKDKSAAHEPHPLLPNTSSFGFVHESPAPTTPAAYGAHASPPGSISFQLPNTKDHIPTPSYQSQKRNRPLTQHQRDLSGWRRSRVNDIMEIGIRKRQKTSKRKRQDEGVILQAWKRIRMLPSGWDSEDEMPSEKKEEGKEKEKEKEDSSKSKIKEEDKAATALKRAANGVRILGGFPLPKTEKEIEHEKTRSIYDARADEDDVGEYTVYLADSFHRCAQRFSYWDRLETEGGKFEPSPRLRPPQSIEDDKEEEEVPEQVVAVTPRPRQSRKKGPSGGGSRKSKGGTVASVETKDDPQAPLPVSNADETMAEAVGDSGELDDEDRELLMEADGDDSEDDDDEGEDDDEDEENMDEDV